MKKFAVMLTLILTAFLSAAQGNAATVTAALPDSTRAMIQDLEQNFLNAQKAVQEALVSFPSTTGSIQKRLSELQAMEDAASSDLVAQYGMLSDTQIQERALLLSNLTTAYSTSESMLQSLQVRRELLINLASADTTDLPNPMKEDPPYSMLLRDEHRLNYEKQKQELDMQLFFLRNDLNNLEAALADLRNSTQGTSNGENPADPATQWKQHLADLNLELVKVRVANAFQSAASSRLKKNEDLQALEREVRLLNWIGQNLVFPESDLKKITDDLQARIDEQRKAQMDAKARLAQATVSYNKIRSVLSGDVPDFSVLTPETSLYAERLANLDYCEYALSLIQDELNWLSEAQQVWKIRYELFHGTLKGDEIWKYRNQAQSNLTELRANLENIRLLQIDYYTRLSAVRKQLLDADGKTRQNMLQLSQTLQNILSNILNRYNYLIPQQLLLQQTLFEEAGAKIDALRLAQQVSTFSRETFMNFWNTKLWSGPDYSVTVSKLVSAVTIFIFSFFLSKWGSRWIQRTILKRFSTDVTAANATQRILFYILWFSFILIALQMVRIPLTAFAFLGGALAVAIGFGAQNLFNNLISGFIIMFSRPFRVGDIVEVDKISGTVEEIGSRSTRLKTWDNIDVILPNKYMLENTVTNWTGTDKKIRDKLVVGVAYSSNSRKVEELLLKVAKDHSKILATPAPFVVFRNFADNALAFELYFWVDMDQASSLKVASDMRHHIHSLFKENGIDIPFPQMDIHMPPQSFIPAVVMSPPPRAQPEASSASKEKNAAPKLP